MFWELLGFFFTEYFFMFGVFMREGGFGGTGDYGGCLAEKDLFPMDGFRLVDRSWQEPCLYGIGYFEDDGELSVVDPTSFPINFGLRCSEPRIS